MTSIDETLLQDFMERFYGYGNLAAPYWFIGMEEGGGNSLDEINLRLHSWHKRGRQITEDLVDYHLAPGIDQFSGKRPRLQSTWSKLIRILHVLEDKPTTTAAIRATQANALGRSNGSSCLLELLPLPSPSIDQWLYGTHTTLEFLQDREIYRETLIPERIKQLRAMIEKHTPQVVVFYGSSYRPYWLQIIQSELEDIKIGKHHLQHGQMDETRVAIVSHPTYPGITNKYFEEAGAILRNRLR